MGTDNIKLYNKEIIAQITHTLLTDFNVFQINTNVVKLANLLHMNVIPATFKDDSIAGLLKFENGQVNIYVNEYQSVNRQRFTIAHEIGHFILHKDFIKGQKINAFYRKDFDNFSDPIEQQANLFAANLLMPEKVIKNLWETYKSTSYLANILKVSEQAVNIRLITLGVINV